MKAMMERIGLEMSVEDGESSSSGDFKISSNRFNELIIERLLSCRSRDELVIQKSTTQGRRIEVEPVKAALNIRITLTLR